MICTVIQNKDAERIPALLGSCEMAEIRLDRCPLTESEVSECFTSDTPLVATCRIAEMMAADPSLSDVAASLACEKRLLLAIEAGAMYVDMEIEAPKQMVKRVIEAAHDSGTAVIRSYHDFSGTGSVESLRAMVEKCLYHGADVVKIVTTATCKDDAGRVLSLYDFFNPEELIAFCMGEAGTASRIECLRRGAPYTYASLSDDDKSAPGQMAASVMSDMIYGGRNFIGYPSYPVLEIPSSKSFIQRAVIAAALADGTSVLDGYSPCGDNDAALELVRKLGASVSLKGNVLTIKGLGTSGMKKAMSRTDSIHVGESGLLTRLMIPLAAALSGGDISITGEKTLLSRPLAGTQEIMSSFGVTLSCGDDGCKVPLRVMGRLMPGNAEISGRYGSQLVSGLLMALPLAGKKSSFTVHDPASIPYIFITMDILKKFDVNVSNEMVGGREFLESGGDWDFCSDILFKIKGGQSYKGAEFKIERDWSSAAYFLVAGAIFGRAELSGLDTGSVQADLSIMDILMDAGASMSQMDGDSGNITVQRSPLNPVSVDMSNCPDLFPIVSILAAFCQGTSRLGGVGRLAGKESDRGKAILEMLARMGVEACIDGDELVIEGHSLTRRILAGMLLKGGRYTSHHDHRMAMALKVASLGADSPIEIDDEECVSKSFPGFHEMFEKMTGGLTA